jgi:hypothetical protein
MAMQETVSRIKNEPEMETIPVFYTIAEKENLEKQAQECETVLSKLIRIRCLMDETDIRIMQQTIKKQEQQIEELRIKLGFFQEKGNHSEPTNQFTEKSGIVNLLKMNQKQWAFLREKYLDSCDYESTESETYPDGTITNNQRCAMLGWEQKYPEYVKINIGIAMLISFLEQIEERLVENCGWNEEELQDDPLIEQFDRLE